MNNMQKRSDIFYVESEPAFDIMRIELLDELPDMTYHADDNSFEMCFSIYRWANSIYSLRWKLKTIWGFLRYGEPITSSISLPISETRRLIKHLNEKCNEAEQRITHHNKCTDFSNTIHPLIYHNDENEPECLCDVYEK